MKRKGWKKRLAKASKHVPGYVEHITATKWSAKKQRKFDDHRLGKFGAASEVRTIKP
jgi:hypothetical protein